MNLNPSDKLFAQCSSADAVNVILYGTLLDTKNNPHPFSRVLRLTSTEQVQVFEVMGKTSLKDLSLFLVNTSASDVTVKTWHVPASKEIADDYLIVPSQTITAHDLLVLSRVSPNRDNVSFQSSDKLFAQCSTANAVNVHLYSTLKPLIKPFASPFRLLSTDPIQFFEVMAQTTLTDPMILLVNTSASDVTINLWHVPAGKPIAGDYLILSSRTIKASSILVWDNGEIYELPRPVAGGAMSVHGYDYQSLNSVPHRTELTYDYVDWYLRNHPLATYKWKLERENGVSEDNTSIVKFGEAGADTQTLLPNEDDTPLEWEVEPHGDHYAAVIDDDEKTYVYYRHAETSQFSISIKVDNGLVYTISDSDAISLTTSYVEHSNQWNTNPLTGLPWTITDVLNYLRIGVCVSFSEQPQKRDLYGIEDLDIPAGSTINYVKVYAIAKYVGSYDIYVHQIEVEIGYTPPLAVDKYGLVYPGAEEDNLSDNFITSESGALRGWYTTYAILTVQGNTATLYFKLKDLSVWSSGSGSLSCKVACQLFLTGAEGPPENFVYGDLIPASDIAVTDALTLNKDGTVSGSLGFTTTDGGYFYYILVVNIYLDDYTGAPTNVKIGFVCEKDIYLKLYGEITPEDGSIFVEKRPVTYKDYAIVRILGLDKVINFWNHIIGKPDVFPPDVHDSDKHTYDLVKQVASDPTPEEGDIWINAASNVLKIFLNAVTKVFSFVGHGKDDHNEALMKQLSSDGTRANGDSWFNTTLKRFKLKQDNIVTIIPTDIITENIGIIVDASGNPISTGIKGDRRVDYACTLTGWSIYADVSGSITFDIWKDTHADFPPIVADTMVGGSGTKPNISASNKGSGTPTNWSSITIAAGDILRFNVDSCSTITRAVLLLKVTRT
jgi:hypothetical protein